MLESERQKLIQLAATRSGAVTFRNNVGVGWVGRSTRKGNYTILEGARPLHAGLCEGSSDLIGWTSVEITPAMVGTKIAVFTAIEVKQPGKRPTPEQVNFIEQVRRAGGFAGVARDPEDIKTIIPA